MTIYSKEEPFIIGIDFDGTITPISNTNLSKEDPPPTKDFIDFFNWTKKWNRKNEFQIYLCIHTARPLVKDEEYKYIKRYLIKNHLYSIYIPKLDGITLKNNNNQILKFPYRAGMNSKIPCSCFIDDINIGTPKKIDGNINWKKIKKLILKEIRRIERKWK